MQTIRDEFSHALNKEYVYKKDAVAPAPAAGSTMQEAAVALACAHPGVSLVARVAADPSHLWRPAPEGAYTRLFGGRPGVHQIWQSVLLLRQVRTVLAYAATGEPPRVRDLVAHGDLLISHLVFQSIGPDTLEELRDPDDVQGPAHRAHAGHRPPPGRRGRTPLRPTPLPGQRVH